MAASKYDIGLGSNFNSAVAPPPPASIHTAVNIPTKMIEAASIFKKNKTETISQFIARLSHLHLNNKKLRAIDNLQACSKLQVLLLYENSIRQITGLDTLTRLVTLDLHANRIERIEGLDALKGLRRLFLDDNCIYRLEGLTQCTQLEELQLNNQQNAAGVDMSFEIESLEAISSTLRVLQLSHSNVIGVAPLSMLTQLEVLHLARNPIFSFEDMAMMLSACERVRDLRVAETPLAEVPKYRDHIIVMSHKLESLDLKEVSERERQFLKSLHARKQAAAQKEHALAQSNSQHALAQAHLDEQRLDEQLASHVHAEQLAVESGAHGAASS